MRAHVAAVSKFSIVEEGCNRPRALISGCEALLLRCLRFMHGRRPGCRLRLPSGWADLWPRPCQAAVTQLYAANIVGQPRVAQLRQRWSIGQRAGQQSDRRFRFSWPRLAALGRAWPRLAALGRAGRAWPRSPDSDRRIVAAVTASPHHRIAASLCISSHCAVWFHLGSLCSSVFCLASLCLPSF